MTETMTEKCLFCGHDLNEAEAARQAQLTALKPPRPGSPFPAPGPAGEAGTG